VSDIFGSVLGRADDWHDHADRLAKEASKPLSERLKNEADAIRRQGDGFKGCTWIGVEHPSSSYYRQASLLDQAAMVALADEQRRAKRKAKRRS